MKLRELVDFAAANPTALDMDVWLSVREIPDDKDEFLGLLGPGFITDIDAIRIYDEFEEDTVVVIYAGKLHDDDSSKPA